MKKIHVKRAAIEVFGGCNYKCTMCPQTLGRGSSWTRKMPLDHFRRLLDQLEGTPLIQLEGSGEAFLAKDLDLYVNECSLRGMPTFIKTNGTFSIDHLQKVLNAGLNNIRFSIIGYDRNTYLENMRSDNFDMVIENVKACQNLISQNNFRCEISLYHLITNLNNIDEELESYKKISDSFNILSSVWKMHNWSGNLNLNQRRILKGRRTCGRPFSEQITIRAGGAPGRIGAVTPCTQTLGPPNEIKSILGHSDNESLYDIFNGELYENLRKLHLAQQFDKIDYCKNCDFLYDDNEVLVWTNDKTVSIGKLQGTEYNLFQNAQS